MTSLAAELIVEAKRPSDNATVTLKLEDLKLHSHGVYSNVYTGMLVETEKNKVLVAIKKCWADEDELKEVRILKRLNRFKAKNIVSLLYVYSRKYEGEKTCFSLIMNYMPSSLSGYIRTSKPDPLPLIETKVFAWQLFRGLQWMHKNDVYHRDLKPQNILVNPETFLLQIADFGSSVIIGEYDSFSSYHVTRYYRPPELLLGAHKYGASIDIWSAGCVFAEMLRGRTFLPGSTTDNQLERILDCFGPPDLSQLQAMNARRTKVLEKSDMIRAVQKFKDRGTNGLTTLVPLASKEAIRLLERIFRYVPTERLRGAKLLSNSFFDECFDPELQQAKKICLLTKEDLHQAVAGDLPPGVDLATLESHTGGSAEKQGSTEHIRK